MVHWCGTTCHFWEDHWIDGSTAAKLASIVHAVVPRRRRKCCSIAKGLADRAWVCDVKGTLIPAALIQYIELWLRLRLPDLALDDRRCVLCQVLLQGPFL